MEARNVFSRETLNLALNMGRQRVSPPRATRSFRLARAAIAKGALQKRSEFAPFLAIALKHRPRTVLEIGRAQGGSLWALCQAAADDATIVSVDLPQGPFGGRELSDEFLQRLEGHAKPSQDLHLLHADSRDPKTVELVRQLIPAIDLLFIDGDHTYEGVASDYRLYSPLVRPGGLIALHDVLHHDSVPECQVDKLWHELSGDKTEIVSRSERSDLLNGGTWGGIGVLRVDRS